MNNACVFCKIIKKDLPATIVFENEDFIAFHDNKPVAKLHLLLVTRKHVESLQHITDNDHEWLGKMMTLIPKITMDNGYRDGFRIVSNAGINSGQEIPHLHFHILGGNILKGIL